MSFAKNKILYDHQSVFWASYRTEKYKIPTCIPPFYSFSLTKQNAASENFFQQIQTSAEKAPAANIKQVKTTERESSPKAGQSSSIVLH